MTHEGRLVVDAVTHAYNSDESNFLDETSREFNRGTYQRSKLYMPEEYHAPPERFFKDVSVEELERVLFLESDVDFAVNHGLPLGDFFKDGLATVEKAVEFRERNPDRSAVYADVNPLADDALADLEYKVKELDVDGIKLYPGRYEDGESLKIALDEGAGHRVVERAAELGIRKIAVHKTMPAGPIPTKFYEVDDVDAIAPSYPDVNFEMVHAGFSFLEETTLLLAKFDNVYANFEVTVNLALGQPRKFARILGEMLKWAGPDKLMFGSGCNFAHPQPLIEAIWDFQFSDELQSEYGYPPLTDEIKAKILGLNALESLHIDPDSVRDAIEGDEWEQARADLEAPPEPWSSIEPAG